MALSADMISVGSSIEQVVARHSASRQSLGMGPEDRFSP